MKTLPNYISFLKENRTREQSEEIFHQRIKDSEKVYEKLSDDFIYRECPTCGETKYKKIEKFNGQYGVVSCEKCSTKFVNPSPNLEALDFYYNNCDCNTQLGNLYNSRAGKKGVILSERSSLVLNLVESLLKTKSKVNILEVGCNSGGFLYELKQALKQKNYTNTVTLTGIDIDESAISNPVDNSIKLIHSSAEAFVETSEESYDLVIHFELIEHLTNPYGFCCAINNLLNEGGFMYFHTPNELGLDNIALSYNDFRPLAHGIFPPMHINAFNPQNISHFLLRCGFKVEKIETPGNFDVDIIRQFCSEDNDLSVIRKIDEQGLAILQFVLKKICGSSHLAVLASK